MYRPFDPKIKVLWGVIADIISSILALIPKRGSTVSTNSRELSYEGYSLA
jgi:hypothetical protein